MPRVSIIMNCYNCAQYLTEAIDSVYVQSYEDWEIVFWDNQSTDDSAKIAQSYDERLRYFRGTEFVPLGVARNLALEQCRGEFVAFLDCDDIWLPEKLEKQMALFEAQPELGLVYSDSYLIRANGERFDTYFNSSHYSPARGHILSELAVQGCFIPLLAVIVRRQVIRELGGFNPKYNIVEDYDMWLRLAAQSPIDFVPEPLAYYRLHATNTMRLQTERTILENIELLEELLNQDNDLSTNDRAKIKANYQAMRYEHGIWHFKQKGQRAAAGALWLKLVFQEPSTLVNSKIWKRTFGGLARMPRKLYQRDPDQVMTNKIPQTDN